MKTFKLPCNSCELDILVEIDELNGRIKERRPSGRVPVGGEGDAARRGRS